MVAKNHYLRARVTKDELEQAKENARAAGYTELTEYIRDRVVKSDTEEKRKTEKDWEALSSLIEDGLAKIGEDWREMADEIRTHRRNRKPAQPPKTEQ